MLHKTLLPITVYPKKYAHSFCFAVLCCGYTLTDVPISIRLTTLALWQSNDGPSASKATLMNMDKYFMWIPYERLHNHNKAKHNKTVRIFLGIYCSRNQHVTSVPKLCNAFWCIKCAWGFFSWYGSTLLPAWVNNYMPIEVLDGMTYPFWNFSGHAVDVWNWISNSIAYPMMGVINYPC